MKVKRLTRIGTTISIFMLILVILLMVGCSSSPTQSPTTSAAPVPPTQSSNTGTSPVSQPSSTANPGTDTVKIGFEGSMKLSQGLDIMHAIEIMKDQINQNGGLNIGGKKYQIDLIEYDNGNTQNGEVSAINRLVFEDKVKFIAADGTYASAWFPITEQNKVINFTCASPPWVYSDAKLHYSFNGTFIAALISVDIGWYCKNHPELTKKVILAATDDLAGHMISQFKSAAYEANGVKPEIMFFPTAQQDLSSLGTKILTENPTTLDAVSMSDQMAGLAFNAARQAGWKGQIFSTSTASVGALTGTMSTQNVEGLINGASPTEFDPPLTQMAKDFKAAWIAKFGSWEDPNYYNAMGFPALTTALEQAGSLDTDKVADVLASGMKYESPAGPGMMISRPDYGNNRTIDSISDYYLKQIKDGKPTLYATISRDEALKIFNAANPPLAPGATPGPPGMPGGGPPPSGLPPGSGPPPDGGLPPGGPPSGGLPPGGPPPQ